MNVREALEFRGALPDKHPVIGSCLLLLGRTLMAQGDLPGAYAAFQECLSLRQSTLPQGHWLIATTMTFIGECLVYLGERERGIAIIGENCEHLVQKLGRAHEQTRLACDRLEKVGRWTTS